MIHLVIYKNRDLLPPTGGLFSYLFIHDHDRPKPAKVPAQKNIQQNIV